jgi:MYXO-CTERM domain-containing protein
MHYTVRPRLSSRLLLPVLGVMLLPSLAAAATLQVGPDKQYKAVKDAVAVAKSGDVIEVDAGEYVDDISSIKVGDLTIRGVGGARAHLKATVPPPNKKGIFVVEAGVGPVTVEHLEFSGSKISANDGNNGAGIRAQGSELTVRDCYFHDNQNGILAGDGLMTIEFSEFAYNGEEGYEHNVYIGVAPKFVFRGNYSHHAKSGHALKSRALENHILYNRLMEEADGNGSALIDLPQGGLSYIIGNLIQKGPAAENKYRVVLYKGEGGTNPDLNLFVSHNTFVNQGAPGVMFVDVKAASAVTLANNLFVGEGMPVVLADMNIPLMDIGNLQAAMPGLVDLAGYDYHLLPGSEPIDAGQQLAAELVPASEYVHPAQIADRPSDGMPDIGAYEFPSEVEGTTGETGDESTAGDVTGDDTTGGGTIDPSGDPTGGPSDPTADPTTDPSNPTNPSDPTTDPTGGPAPTTGGLTSGDTAETAPGTGSESGAIDEGAGGCGCRSDAGGSAWALLGVVALAGRRRRRG